MLFQSCVVHIAGPDDHWGLLFGNCTFVFNLALMAGLASSKFLTFANAETS